jgi:hypothetical protein
MIAAEHDDSRCALTMSYLFLSKKETERVQRNLLCDHSGSEAHKELVKRLRKHFGHKANLDV